MRSFLDSQKEVFAKLMALTQGPAVPPPGKAPPMERYAMVPKPSPLQPGQVEAAGAILVVADSAPVAAAIESSLAAAGAKVASLGAQPDHTPADVTAARARLGRIGGVVFAVGIGRDPNAATLADWREMNRRGAKRLFAILQATADDLRHCGGRVVALSAMGGAFGRSGSAWHSPPSSGAAVGLIKTAAIEWPEVTFRAVDLESPEPADIGRIARDEFFTDDPAPEVGYIEGRRVSFEAVLADPPPSDATLPANAVVLVTGGARGITAEALRGILGAGMTLHLAGRAPEPGPESDATAAESSPAALRKIFIAQASAAGKTLKPVQVEKEISNLFRDREIRRNLAEFRQACARVTYHSVDVRNEADMAGLLEGIYAADGRIDVVLHGAGVIEDKLLADKTPESFDRVFDTKADSTWVLGRHLRPDSLRYLGLFASIAGRTGNRGQCDYAAANELVNRFGWWLSARWPHVRVSSINWGPWESGMASAEVNRQFRERGITPIPPAAGREFFRRELLVPPSADVEVMAGYFGEPQPPLPSRWPLIAPPLPRKIEGHLDWPRRLTVGEMNFLKDHRIDGKAVGPFVCAMELAAETIQSAWPGWRIAEVTNHQQFRGLIVPDEVGLPVRVTASATPEGDALIVNSSLIEDSATARPCYRGSFRLVRELPPPPAAPALAPCAPANIPPKEFYGGHAFHGPAFRLLEVIDGLDANGLDALVRTEGTGGWTWTGRPWIFHPGLADITFQLASFWGQHVLQSFALPTKATRIARFGPFVVAPQQARIHIRILEAGPTSIRFDFFIADAGGRLMLHGSDLQMAHSKDLMRLARQGPPV